MKVQRITKKLKCQYMKHKLASSENWAIKAMLIIYHKQTPTERALENTSEPNGVGFSGHDANFMCSLSKQYENRKFLSAKQKALVLKHMPKYWKQVLTVTNEKRLVDCMLKDKWITQNDYDEYQKQQFLNFI